MGANGQPGVALRDLSDSQFADIYSTDRFTASVLSSRMRYIVKHMCTGLLNNAFSLILRDWYDFAATISGPPQMNYPMSTVSDSLVLFLGTMAEAVRNTVEEYGAQNLQPGDVLAVNDPYRTGNHVNDVCFIRPVFHQGKLLAFVTIRAHQLDMGGVVPAGFSGSKRNVYETGLVIPPMLLYRDDKPVRSTFNLIFDNARFCALLLPDIKSLYQNLLLGERLLLESVERYGADALLGAIRYSCDISADAMREAIRTKIPDGVYEAEEKVDADGVDDSIEYDLKLKITKHGEDIEFDLSGTSAQARSSINCGPLDVKTAIGVALKMLIEQDTPYTSGSYRNIDVVIPAGTLCSATPPDGPIFLYWESSIPVMFAVYRALERVLGRDAVGGDYGSLMIHNANGVGPNGVPWVTAAQCGGEHGPWSGTKAGDGDSYTVFYMANNIDPATEAIESDIPVVVLRKEYAIDTAGRGANRGGAAVLKDTLWLSDAEHWSMPTHAKSTSGFGVNGGGDGTAQASWVFPPAVFETVTAEGGLPTGPAIYRQSIPVGGRLDPESKTLDPNGTYFYFASTPIWKTRPHTMFRYQTAGGGGWGDPLARDPERVMRDVRDEYISFEGARRDYGVVVIGDPVNDPEGLRIDRDATRQRRTEMASPL
ncbi:MAG: hydantoinase B/oxoprolinase family protein [Pseudomonadota bacterium]|nr:hydantoinase B/oxoprolinase family protein [Pseudomonadota bacterium]